MSPKKTVQIASALQSKGFRPSNRHHTYYILYVNGRKTSVRTKVSHGIREYGKSLLGQMSKQLGVSRRQLDRLIECPMSEEEYVSLLIRNNRIKNRVEVEE